METIHKLITVGVPCLFGKREDLHESIRSFLDPSVDVIAIDNGSSDECKSALAELEGQISVVRNPHNVFVNPAWNQIAELFLSTSSEILVIANSDIVLSDGWVQHLIRVHEISPDHFWLGNQVSRERLTDKSDVAVRDAPHAYSADGSWGSFFALRRRDVERCFPIPHDLKLHFGDEWVFSFLRRTGVLPAIVNGIKIWHEGAVSINRLRESDNMIGNDRRLWHSCLDFACKRAADAAVRGSKMDALEVKYTLFRDTAYDINEHMPTIRAYARQCRHVTEFGFGRSTYAIAHARPNTMRCYDPSPDGARASVSEILELAHASGIDLTFSRESDLSCSIEQTEMLFIDTIHTFSQLSAELSKHSDSVSKYILMHDTETFGEIGEDRSTPGLNEAIDQFLAAHHEWALEDRFRNNNGLTILKRVNP